MVPALDGSLNLSVIIPAYNEELLLKNCISSVKEALKDRNTPFEIIVCDNNSSDKTAAIAAACGAKTVFEPANQISKARNTGAKNASGRWLLFLDADSILSKETACRMLEQISSDRCAGGGSVIGFGSTPLYFKPVIMFWNAISNTFKWAAGSFIFCRTDAFRETGGFSNELFAAEEIELSMKLKKWGKKRKLDFVILRGAPHISSARKLHLYTFREFLCILAKIILNPYKSLRNKNILFHLYDGRR